MDFNIEKHQTLVMLDYIKILLLNIGKYFDGYWKWAYLNSNEKYSL